jgi:RNA polymerase sigma-70 factor, ECF subfamily
VISDEDLMIACRNGSKDAFGELFSRYRQAIWGYFCRRLTDPARAEELAQETFVAVFESASRYEPRALFRTYLYSIAFNLLSGERRKLHNHPSEPLDELKIPAAGLNPDSGLWVKRAIAQLDTSDREILLLREYEQFSYAEIADLLSLPLNTVRSRLFRARLELRRLLMPEVETRGSFQ